MTPPDKITVTQADRAALCDVFDLSQSEAMEVVGGKHDANPKMMRALSILARHRLAATSDNLALDALEALQSELQEQARIIGMSGEREAAHLARIAQLEAELAGAREAALEEAARACEKAGGAGFATDFARVVRALAEPRT